MNLEKLRKLVNEVCDACDAQEPRGGFEGEEKASGGKMARTDLVTIAKDAHELVNMFGDDAELPDWVESKLTKAADYLNSVKRYIGGEIARQQGGLMEEGLSSYRMAEEEQIQQLASAATSGMATLKDPAKVQPTVLDYFFSDNDDKMAFLDYMHSQIKQELKSTSSVREDSLNAGDQLAEEYFYISDATYDDGTPVEEDMEFWDDVLVEAEYQGRKVTLNKPMKGDVKKSKVYVRDPKTGNVKKVNFGDKKMKIKKSNPKRRKSFRARYNCKNPGPKTKARYWSCRAW